jgi:hypothetical protein
MATTSKPTRLLIDLDALFDTRLVVLSEMEGDALTAALKHGYHERVSDSFPGVDFNDFKERYKKRDKRTLAKAFVTPLINLIKEFAIESLRNVNNTPFHNKPIVVINEYPYKLLSAEAAEIVNGVRHMTNGMCDIETVYLEPAQLTPLYVKLNLALMIMYDYEDWLEIHAVNGNWKKHTAPDVTLLVPMMSKLDVTQVSKNMHDNFLEIQKAVAPFVDLKFINTENFSLVLKAEHFHKANQAIKDT